MHDAPMTKYLRPNLSDNLPFKRIPIAEHVDQIMENREELPPASP
jgi:hypothetical protein